MRCKFNGLDKNNNKKIIIFLLWICSFFSANSKEKFVQMWLIRFYTLVENLVKERERERERPNQKPSQSTWVYNFD
jgi:hypothetical protein